jgi:hypothetical protein
MDCLPLEIIATIVSYLPKHTTAQAETAQTTQLVRPRIACLSRKWQFAVERLVYREVRFKHTELDEFAAVFSQPRRRGLLQTLQFEIVLPSYGDAECAVYESDQERLTNNRIASEAITALFGVLATWGSDPARAAILLYIHVYSPMDPPHRGTDKLAQDRLDNLCRRRADLFEQRYQHSYIQFPDPANLPAAPCLRAVVPDAGARQFHPSSSLALLTAAGSVTNHLSWQYAEPGVYAPLRRQMRDELVHTLQTFRLPSSVRRFTVDFESYPYEHAQRLPDLVSPRAHDPLCAALHRVVGDGEGLEALAYTGQVDPSLFWPYSYAAADGGGGGGGGEPPEPFWGSLAELTVDFDMRSPSGRWYFRAAAGDAHNVPSSDEPLPADGGYMPPGYGSDEDEWDEAAEYEVSLRPEGREGDGTLDLLDDFRVVPDEEVLVPLLEAFARAVAQMPALKTACLTSRLPDPYLEWFVVYATPGNLTDHEEYMEEDDSTGAKPRVFLHVHGWTAPEQVLDTLRKIGQKRHGQDAIVTYIPSLYE